MIPRTHHRPAAALVLTCASLVVTARPCSAARWYEDYQMAVASIDQGGCSPEALQLLGAAVVDKPRPRRGVRTYAQRRIDYLPYLQLARAHLSCGNLALARSYLEQCRSRAVASADELRPVEHGLAELEAQAAAEPQLPAVDAEALARRVEAAREHVARAEGALDRVQRLMGEAELAEIVASEPGLARRQRSARDTLSQARTNLDQGVAESDPLTLADAVTMASNAINEATELERELVRGRDRLREQREGPGPLVASTPMPVATPTLPPRPPPTPFPSPRPLRPGPEQVPAPLRRAALLFFRGQYAEVVETLARPGSATPRDQATAHLLRGAARWSLLRLGADADEDLRAAAVADLRECHRLDAAVRPAGRLFSPAFEQFFSSATAGTPQ